MDTKHIAPFTEAFSTVMSQLGFSETKGGDLTTKGDNISFKMSSNEVLGIKLFADDFPVEINVAFEK